MFRFTTWENLKSNIDKLARRQTFTRQGALARIGSYKNVLTELPAARNLLSGKKKYNVAVITTTTRLRVESNGRYKNIYFDFFEPPLPNTLYVYADSRSGREPAAKPSVFLSNKAALPALLRLKLFPPKDLAKTRALYSDLRAHLEQRGHTGLFDLPFAAWKRMFIIYLAKKHLLAKVLSAIEAKVFIVDCAYGKEWAVAAAKQAGVPAYELQHGIPDGNVAYFYEPQTAARYKERLPVPDKILTFGRYFSENLSRDNLWTADQMVPVGLARLEKLRQDFDYQPPGPGETLRVLITSQWVLTARLVEYLEAAVEKIPPGVKISLKPHPLEGAAESYRKLGDKIEILDKTREYYDLLKNCHVHCSVYSTTLLESIGLGVPTLILGLPGSEAVLPVAEGGFCRMADSPEVFASILHDAVHEPGFVLDWHKSTVKNRSYIWEPNASRNIHEVLSGLGAE